jgi:hypothetical protein
MQVQLQGSYEESDEERQELGDVLRHAVELRCVAVQVEFESKL